MPSRPARSKAFSHEVEKSSDSSLSTDPFGEYSGIFFAPGVGKLQRLIASNGRLSKLTQQIANPGGEQWNIGVYSDTDAV
ncbi:MAG: hypothetical protein M5R38_12365 [Candidatus Methylomirabilis sp.]|nr:hypothetical protein [Candidatus Methylomirabilis sp.]